jgi:hypothetical protein
MSGLYTIFDFFNNCKIFLSVLKDFFCCGYFVVSIDNGFGNPSLRSGILMTIQWWLSAPELYDGEQVSSLQQYLLKDVRDTLAGRRRRDIEIAGGRLGKRNLVALSNENSVFILVMRISNNSKK